MTERIGIFGGTFDPVHNGHLATAADVRSALGLDRVLLVVAGDPWQKAGQVQASAADRLALVEVAVAGIDGLEASAIEVEREGPTYSVDTLETLACDDRELFMILGADAAARLDTWREPERVRKLATVVVVDRDGTAGGLDGAVHVAVPRLDISSTDIRDRIAHRRPIYGLVPEPVVHGIAARGLYTGPQW